MVSLREGNLLEADVEAVVNTVNTVGVMGKGIALMFKDRYPENFKSYARACKNDAVQIGRIFVTENRELFGPRWILNFPTKIHWRHKSQLEWIDQGLEDLVRVIEERRIRSIAVPPLGCGNGGLKWRIVKYRIVDALEQIEDLDALLYVPTTKYQNVPKSAGAQKLTPARALIAEMVRRYCQVSTDCTILEVQKLAWFIDRAAKVSNRKLSLRFDFKADRYGPYSQRLTKLLDHLDGSYLRCSRRLADARPNDNIWFDLRREEDLSTYLMSEGNHLQEVITLVADITDGLETPYDMELLSTVDWLVHIEGVEPTPSRIWEELNNWPADGDAGWRKQRLFDEAAIEVALMQLRRLDAPLLQSQDR